MEYMVEPPTEVDIGKCHVCGDAIIVKTDDQEALNVVCDADPDTGELTGIQFFCTSCFTAAFGVDP